MVVKRCQNRAHLNELLSIQGSAGVSWHLQEKANSAITIMALEHLKSVNRRACQRTSASRSLEEIGPTAFTEPRISTFPPASTSSSSSCSDTSAAAYEIREYVIELQAVSN